jgi:prepilin-type N-terminal cleavage/methylation domain-containing protein
MHVPSQHGPDPGRGFVLLEVVLALALFAIVATAMTTALNQLAESTTSARRESMLLRRLQSEIAENSRLPLQHLGRSESPADESGIAVSREVSRLELKNQNGVELTALYRIHVSATIPLGPGSRERLVREMETFTLGFDELQKSAEQFQPGNGRIQRP